MLISNHAFVAIDIIFCKFSGTVNSEPYIIPSDKLRKELRIAARNEHGTKKRSLAPYQTPYMPVLEDLKVGMLLKEFLIVNLLD